MPDDDPAFLVVLDDDHRALNDLQPAIDLQRPHQEVEVLAGDGEAEPAQAAAGSAEVGAHS